MKVLGIHLGKTSGCSVFIDDEIKFAVSEERFSRLKSDESYPKKSIDEALKFCKIDPSELRLTLDYQEDFELAKIIFEKLDNNFSLNDILNLFNREPELLKITQPVIGKWQLNYKNNISNFSLKSENKSE